MTPFLKSVAIDIYNKFGGNLSDIAIVFPNKRAGLFFNEYLVQNSTRPIWSPQYLTISELLEQNSVAVTGDPILLVSKLYKQYIKHTHSNESIDRFYHWGELLIKDFDDIDKHLADADKLFANLHELRELGNGSDILDEEQRAAIKQFFSNFKPEEESELKERFLKIWRVMGPIYHDFRAALRAENIAYEGMLYRDILENADTLEFPHKKYIFVGFNALNKVECKLFDILAERQQALFYWDYDTSYTDAEYHEAGHFMRQNLKRYPNALTNYSFNTLGNKKRIKIVSSATNSIQTRYVPQWIKENLSDKEIETAVVLCDETMLEPVLHTIPEDVRNINVTMGYPISHTPVYSLLRLLIDLQINGYDEEHDTFTLDAAHNLLSHPYILQCSPNAAETDKKIIDKRLFFPPVETLQADDFLARIFCRRTDNSLWFASIGDIIFHIAKNLGTTESDKKDIYNELFREALLKAFTQTQRFISIIESGELQLKQSTIGNLFMRALSSQSMPFHGEPVVGLQIMGLLETRNLDFKNIILLSANEGNLPKTNNENSFIPYNLRRAFGLTLSEYRDSIYAYNFFRLIQRAENITLMYNSSVDSATRGECSRYILQLQASNLHKIEKINLEAEQNSKNAEPVCVRKTAPMLEKLITYFDHAKNPKAHILSPTGINRYLACPLRFFYYYLMNLRRHDDITTELRPNDFGTIFHAAAEDFYNELTQGKRTTIEKKDLQPFIEKEALLYKYVDRAFGKHFFKQEDEKPTYDGEQYINREVLHRFLVRLLKCDAAHAPFTYIGSEQTVKFSLQIPHPTEKRNIELCLGGSADRIDKKDDTLEIIDYKTGGSEEKPDNLEQIFAYEGKNPGYIFQALLYSVAAKESNMARKVSPSLLYIHKKAAAQREDFIVKLGGEPITDISPLHSEFIQKLKETLSEIFDIETPFTPTDDRNRCEWCDYKKICGL